MAAEFTETDAYDALAIALRGTPYLPPDDGAEVETFQRALTASASLDAKLAEVRMKATARVPRLLGGSDRFFLALIVAESNQIEGKPWSQEAVRRILDERQSDLELDVAAFVSAIISDPKLVETIGLAKAYTVSEALFPTNERPFSASDLRSLHGLIVANEAHAGDYKRRDNSIGGRAEHLTVPITDAPRAVAELCSWLERGSGHKVLDAAIAHTWLVHLHPFEDGNGRLARVLANMILTGHGFPPLILRSASDRSEYMAALERSDDGDLSVLFMLFVKVIGRYVRHLGDPRTLQRLVSTGIRGPEAKLHPWQLSVDDFLGSLDARCRAERGWRVRTAGRTTPEAFDSLVNRDRSGNHWRALIVDGLRDGRGLIWIGHQSDEIRKRFRRFAYPSIFFSASALGPRGEPFIPTTRLDGRGDDVLEVGIRPDALSRVVLRFRSGRITEVSMNDAVTEVSRTVLWLPVVIDPRLA